ncbi:DUF3189 family protein [Bacillota bacterium LX-D]|nr:DUF3189 family protein [Bacillota bacterium LX-D]
MNIIYHCFGGAHSSVTAAAIHLGLLSTTHIPSVTELMKVPFFDYQINADHGQFRLMGTDELGNKVFFIGRRNLAVNFEILIKGLVEMNNLSQKDFILINTMPLVNWKMVVGGFLSRGLQTPRLGRPIVLKGVQHSFFKYVGLVENVKRIYINK